MSLTVGELLSRQHLRLELIVAGDLERSIRWVHSSDMPDPAPYLRGDELVLTAGIWYWHGTAAGSFAASLGHARAAAVGFGINPLVAEVPDELIDACRGWELTLFRVPQDIAFIQIAEEFVEAQHRQRERALAESLDRSSQFVASLQIGGGLTGLLRVLGRLVCRPAAVVQRGRGVLAAIDPPAGVESALTELDAALASGAPVTELPPLTAFAIPITPGDASLVIESGNGLSVSDRMIIDQALAFVTIELQRERAVADSERRFAGELFDLAAAGPAQLPTVTARLRSLGLDPDGSLCAAACTGGDPERTRHTVIRELAQMGRPGVVVVKAASVLAIVQASGDDDLAALGEALHRACGTGVSIGIGGITPGASGLSRSLLEAAHASRIARRPGAEGFATHDGLASHALLLELQDDQVLDTFRRTLIAPLEEHDRRRHTDLVTTLEMFLGSGGRYQQTAEALHLHVNSLRQRLGRVEQLTGRDLSSMDDRVDLWIALRARER